MDQSRWKKVNQIFHAALEVDFSERLNYVQSASEGDPELEEEVGFLLKADKDAGSYLESPLLTLEALPGSSVPLKPGDSLCKRFHIKREIAEGGMGRVFEAFDSELSVHVALKVIRPEIATNPDALTRFRQEVRLARQITHPNVCRTFDIERDMRTVDTTGSEQEIVFLTMEFLEGETLASKIKRTGALPLEVAHDISRQIASGMQVASALGIVHRDLKPANVMLIPTGISSNSGIRAVITDFGLARVDPLVSPSFHGSLSSTLGRPMGTIAYMAPEQLSGSPVSPITDIYAFGLILFEMVTGIRAFPSEDFLGGISHRLGGKVPNPRTIIPNLPLPWCRAIEGCLQVDPSLRFQDFAEVLTAIEGDRRSRSKVHRAQSGETRLISGSNRRGLAVVFAVLLFVALFFIAFRFRLSRDNSDVGSATLIYLAPVRNETGDKSFDSITELLKASLSQSSQINVLEQLPPVRLLDEGRVGDLLQHMMRQPVETNDDPTARQLAMRAGAARVVFATVTRSGERCRMDIEMQEPDSSPGRYRQHWIKSFTWSGDGQVGGRAELFSTVRTASEWIRNEAGESKNDIARADAPPEDVTTSSWEALEDLSDAERFLAKGKQEKTIASLQDAVKHDPAFSFAYARLGDVLLSMNRSSEGYKAYLDALRTDGSRRLTRRERDRIRGIYSSDTEDFESAKNAFRDYATYYETDYLGWFYQALPLEMLGRNEESVSVMRKAVALAPAASVASKASLVDHLAILGQLEEAHQWIEKIKKDGHIEEAEWREGDIAFLEHRFRDAESAYSAMAASTNPKYKSLGLDLLARLKAEQGDYTQAILFVRSGIELAKGQGDDADQAQRLIDLAYLEFNTSHYDQCIADIRKSIVLYPSPRGLITASAVLGEAFQRAPAGLRTNIRSELSWLERESLGPEYGLVSELARVRLHGEVALATGHIRRAIEEFTKADKLQAPADEREYLGRAFVALASLHSGSSSSQKALRDACDAYGSFALRPRFAWEETLHHPPGFFSNEATQYLKLAAQTKRPNPETREVAALLSHLRNGEQ